MRKPFKILVVDDSEIVRAAVHHVLAETGHEIRMVDNGADALRLAAEFHPDLMLLDVNLPDINGLEVCRRIKQDPKLKSILVMHLSAARISSEDSVEGLESGAGLSTSRRFLTRNCGRACSPCCGSRPPRRSGTG